MKKILQALDGAANKPVEGSTDMKKFMSIVTEGANPHKVSLPVQMAMQHYQEPVKESKPTKTSLLKNYIQEAEEELASQKVIEEQRVRMYSRKIAQKVLGESKWPTGPIGNEHDHDSSSENPPDVVKLDIPLLIRLLEYAREDAKTDMDLHNVTEMLISLSEEGNTLTMDQYDQIVGDQKMLPSPTNETCWKNYKQLGMKEKGKKLVPNCVPKK